MNQQAEQLRQRLRRFATRVMKFVRTLPRDPATAVVAGQLAGSDTAMSSNYHAACRGRSRREFIAKLGVALEEADETEHWLELLQQDGRSASAELASLRAESSELRAILKSSVDTARRNFARLRPDLSRSKSPNKS
jgi:four helix bundle protein